MRRLILLVAARRGLVAIDDYVLRATGSLPTARRFTDQLRERCIRLAALPGTLGVARPELGSELRSLSHENYLIMFRYTPGSVQVIRVLEGHRKLTDQFEPGDT